MPQIDVCFVWHMHQPFYKDLVRGDYKLPWTRLHALKDYYGMVKILGDFPKVRQTFNLVPSMLVQVDEYAQSKAEDPFLRMALKPAEELDPADRAFLCKHFFQANVERLIFRYPRYRDLYLHQNREFSVRDFRDLQVLSQLAWFDELFLTGDQEIAALVKKGRDYTHADQILMGKKQLGIIQSVVPVYREFAESGQIEISTTPFYHPILPLLCDSGVAAVSSPTLPLPTRFRYPEDAREQLQRARAYMKERTGIEPKGLWPSEGSVSDEALALAAECGFQWFATDNGVLSRTLGRAAGVSETYRPYLWKQGSHEMHGIFRDHYLSDLVGFTYSRMGPEEAADHFIGRILENCGHHDCMVPVILDGENAWEYFPESGREFLRQVYHRLSNTPGVSALTVSEALERHRPEPLRSIFPGSWINANFEVWIGFEEDNRAWEYLLRARQAFDKHASEVSEANRTLAYDELLISEGSDWCWWYGPHHHTDNRAEFDQLFRDHLSNVYRLLDLPIPLELHRPILHGAFVEHIVPPAALIKPVLDGQVTSYFEWMGAGEYQANLPQGAMHSAGSGLQMFYYGTDGIDLFLRLDFEPLPDVAALELHLTSAAGSVVLPADALHARRIVEASVPLSALGAEHGNILQFQVSLWLNGVPANALPHSGWLDLPTADPAHWV